MAQTNYSYGTPRGVAGGLVDLGGYVVDTRCSEAENGTLKFGMGVVVGTKAGVNIALPATASTAAEFEGVLADKRTHEMNMDGTVTVSKGETVGVVRKGRVYVRVKGGTVPTYLSLIHI